MRKFSIYLIALSAIVAAESLAVASPFVTSPFVTNPFASLFTGSVQAATNTAAKEKTAKDTKATESETSPWHKRYRHIDKETGLRTAYYRAALPDKVPGGTRIDVKQAFTHFKNKSALFVDVMAHTGTGPDPIDGHWRLSEPRRNIPGSHWLADVGTGTLSPALTSYYETNLARLTKGDKTTPLVIYCTADCWMAWNAVRRAARLGYSNILWFPEGSDDWRVAGHELADAVPIPVEISE